MIRVAVQFNGRWRGATRRYEAEATVHDDGSFDLEALRLVDRDGSPVGPDLLMTVLNGFDSLPKKMQAAIGAAIRRDKRIRERTVVSLRRKGLYPLQDQDAGVREANARAWMRIWLRCYNGPRHGEVVAEFVFSGKRYRVTGTVHLAPAVESGPPDARRPDESWCEIVEIEVQDEYGDWWREQSTCSMRLDGPAGKALFAEAEALSRRMRTHDD